MATTCQHCGATTDNDARVMCPSCGRRMQPAHRADSPAAPDPQDVAAPPPSPYAPPPYASGYPYGPSLPPQVDVYFRRDAIARTSRLTVLVRLILVLPHFIVLLGASLAAALLTIITWFAALILARVPAGLYEALGWVVGYGTRVTAYLFFLTDRWPTFTEQPDDPVLVRLPGPGRLNRAAVLFRIVLLIPVGFLAEFVNQGLAIVSVVGWVLILVLGRVPQPLFDASASVVRYQTRYFAYAAMLTARYPGGLFGDMGDPGEPPPVGLAQPPTAPAINRPAKWVVVTILVLGVLAFLARSVISASNNNTQSAEHARAGALPVHAGK